MRFVLFLILFIPSVFAQVCIEDQYRITLPEKQTEQCEQGQWVKSDYETLEARLYPSLFARFSTWWQESITPLFAREPDSINDEQETEVVAEKESTDEPEQVVKEIAPEPVIPAPIPVAPTPEPKVVEELPIVETQLALCGDILSDTNNCGACDTICPTFAGTFTRCMEGKCTNECERGFVDANAKANDGCECALDQYEPNDALANATDLGILTQGNQRTLLLHAGDYDYFRIYAEHTPDTPFEIRAVSDDRVDICIYKEDQILSCKRGVNTFVERTGFISGGGTYFISAFNPNCKEYTLLIKNS